MTATALTLTALGGLSLAVLAFLSAHFHREQSGLRPVPVRVRRRPSRPRG